MNVTISKNNIKDILANIQGICGRKTNLKITSDVLINASDKDITITANNLETVFQGNYDAVVELEGIISINAGKFYEIIREYPDNEIPLKEPKNRWVEIGKGHVKYNIVASDWKNFPETPVIESIDFIEADAWDLKKMVDATSCITYGPDEKRPYVLGVLLEKVENTEDNTLRIVSTDSKRLHCYESAYTGYLTLPGGSILIPKKGFSQIGKFVENKEGNIKIGVKDNHLIAVKENETLMIKLIHGEYPDYRGLMDTETLIRVDIDRVMLLTMMRRMSILTSEEYKSIILKFGDNELVTTVTNPDIGESRDQLEISYTDGEIEGAFNPRYFIEALKIIESDTVSLYLKDGDSPCLIKGIDDDKLVCIIMAMHIS